MGELKLIKLDPKDAPRVDLGTAVLRLEPDAPPQWVLDIARKELRETPEIAEPAIKKLRELLQAEKNLYIPLDDEYLTMALRPSHFYPESCIKKLRNVFNLDKKYGDNCQNILPAAVRHVFEANVVHLLPQRDQLGRRMLILEPGKKWKPSEVPLKDVFRCIQLMVLSSMVEPVSQICGAVVIINMDGLSMGHIMHFTPSFAMMLLDFLQECLIMRLKAVHIINNSYVFNILFNIFKPFIKEKLRKRIFFHGKDLKSLTKHIDASVLPAVFGGTAAWGLPSGKDVADLFMAYTPDFETVATYGYNKGDCNGK